MSALTMEDLLRLKKELGAPPGPVAIGANPQMILHLKRHCAPMAPTMFSMGPELIEDPRLPVNRSTAIYTQEALKKYVEDIKERRPLCL